MKSKTLLSLLVLGLTLITAGCGGRSGDEVWDDTKSCGRHLGRGIRSLGGKHGDSRQICSKDTFSTPSYNYYQESEFVPLQDEQGNNMLCMENVQFAREPGEYGSNLPGIEAFKDPSSNPRLAMVFQHIHFDYDSDVVQGQENLQRAKTIADYLTQHPNTTVYIEGHCDERGPQAYNLALGTRRANAVRNIFIAEGVNPNNLFTISYGKERPISTNYDLNRRAQFKVYEQ